MDLARPAPRRGRSAAPRRVKLLNDVDLGRLVELYRGGATVYELADLFNVNRKTIALCLKRQGLTLRLQPPTTEQVDEMVQLYESGLSLAKVGERLGFGARTVQRQLWDRGVRMRDTHGQVRL